VDGKTALSESTNGDCPMKPDISAAVAQRLPRFSNVALRSDGALGNCPVGRLAIGIATDIAEGFKQGAEMQEASKVDEGWPAPCLKSLCAKPLGQPSSYGF
jgi:hypothetical protein